MKKILLVIIMILSISFSINSQIVKGKFLLGSNFSFSKKEDVNTRIFPFNSNYENSLNVTGAAGYLVRDNLAIGISPVFGFQNSKYQNSNIIDLKSRYRRVGISSFIRKYKKIGPKWYAYLQGAVNYYHDGSKIFTLDKKEGQSFNDRWDSNIIGVGVTPGINFFITPEIAVEAQIELATMGAYFDNFNYRNIADRSTGFNFDWNLNLSSIHAGLAFYIGRNN
jgi:hypothetical protein